MTKPLPQPTGPYTIGLHKVDLHDPYRKEITYPEGRLIPIQFYFPCEAGEHSPQPKVFEHRAPQEFSPLEALGYSKPTSFSQILPGKHPLILFNHGNQVAMTDYACIAEDLASHGYVVVAIQHQLSTDGVQAPFLNGRSTAKHGQIIDNLLYVFDWLKTHYGETIDTNKVGLIGHSMGGNALLLLSNRIFGTFRKGISSLLPREDKNQDTHECIVFLDGEFTYPRTKLHPIMFCLSEERKPFQEMNGTLEDLQRIGYPFHHYKGTRHISFMDHSAVNGEPYFNGTESERIAFWNDLRRDIRDFLRENMVM